MITSITEAYVLKTFQTLVFVNKCTLVPVATLKVQNLILYLSNELH